MFLSLSILKEIVYDTNLFQALINFLVNKKISKGNFFLFDIFYPNIHFFPQKLHLSSEKKQIFFFKKGDDFSKKKINTVIIPKFLFAEADMKKLTFQINI